VVGATPTDDGWRCPRRHNSLASQVVRINTFLERQGFTVVRHGVADREVERELERRRSFTRTREAAINWKAGSTTLDLTDVRRQLSEFGWSQERELRPHQELGLAHALTAVNAANFSVPGSGKTAIALATAATHLAAGTIDLILVVGPLACFGPWEHETATALGAHLQTRRVRGNASQRRAAYAAARPGTLLMVSFASAAADRLALVELCKSHDVMLVVDESHRIKRFQGGQWAPALVQIAGHARARMILSGTPMPQSGRDLYSQLNVLWPGGELTGPRDGFAARVDTNFGSVLHDVHPFVARTPKAALGLLPYEIHRHDVPLRSTQAEIYDLIVSRFRRRIEDATTWADKLETLRRARPVRLLQAAANPDLFNRADQYYRLPRVEGANPTLMDRLATYAEHEVPAKSEAALALLAEITAQGGKAVCWSNFIGNLDQFTALVRERLRLPCFQIDGRVPVGDEPSDDWPDEQRPNPDDIDTRERIIDRFLGTQGPAVLITNPASCSESISLHRRCHHAIYLDRTYDCAQYLQSIDRIHRLGLPRDVVVQIHILQATVEGQPTIDHLVDASLRGKEAVMLELLEGAELYPIAQSADPVDDAEGTTQDLAALLRYLLGEERSG
jgi:SNF2 family DNA or RNA helicase